MTHDPLCYWHYHYKGPTPVQVDPANDKWEWIDLCADCDLIAKVREDMLAKCIAAVEAIEDGGVADTRYILASTAVRYILAKTVATLRALLEGDKP